MPTVEMLVYRMSNVVAASPITYSHPEVPFSDPRMTKREILLSGFIFDIFARGSKSDNLFTSRRPII